MHPILRAVRPIVPSVLVGLQALALVSCEPVTPLSVQQPGLSPDSTSLLSSTTAARTITISASDSSLTPGQQVQVKFVAIDPRGNLRPAPNLTWSVTPTSVATISSSGLVTAGATSGTATVQVYWEGTIATLPITVGTAASPSAAVRNITVTASASQIKIGQTSQVTGVVKDGNGNTITNVPIIWTTAPVAVATATTNTSTTGTITGKGVGTATIYAKADTVTRQITITVLDSATTQAPVPPGATGGSYGGATAAELPRVSVNTTYPAVSRQVRVPAGGNLQAAIDAAQAGDEILLAPGATFTGNFWIRDKGQLNGWITIRTDLPDATLGQPGTRMTPSRAASLRIAKIVTPNIYSSITTQGAANHYRFTGIEFAIAPSVTDMNALIVLGDNMPTQNSPATTASFYVLDRSYIHGNPNGQLRRCVMMNSATTAVIDSWLGECHSNMSESQAIIGWNGPGPYLIQNNHLEAGHEVIMFGGGGMTTPNASPSDITIRGNHITRPVSWKNVWQVKNLIESKHAKRMLIEGNVIENNWADAQTGFAILLKSENQLGDTPWTQTADVTVRYNKLRNVGQGFNLAGNPATTVAVNAARMVITDNVIENVGNSPYDGEGRTFQFLNGLSDIVIMHNTVTSGGGSSPAAMYLNGGVTRLVAHSNILHHGSWGVKGDASGEGTVALNLFAPGYLFKNNAIANGGTASAYPANTYFPATLSALGFVNLSGGDYHLSSTSGYLNKGYDGRDIGADINKVNSMTSGAVIAP
jgi:hypothetical protein